jgi:hypothetical protein
MNVLCITEKELSLQPELDRADMNLLNFTDFVSVRREMRSQRNGARQSMNEFLNEYRG